MHTYAGSGQLALLAGIEVLRKVPTVQDHIIAMGKLLGQTLMALEKETEGFVRCFGQGLMWGCLFEGNQEERTWACQYFRSQCLLDGVWPYFVPLGGFQLTP